MTGPIILVLTSAIIAQAFFCISVLLLRALRDANHILLAIIFLIICFASGGPLFKAFAPEQLQNFYGITLPAYLLLGPVFWFYICWITASQQWRFKTGHIWHLVPPILSALSFAIQLYHDVFNNPPDWNQTDSIDPILQAAGTVGFMLVLFWLFQATCYIYLIFKRIIEYRQNLRRYFSNHRGLSLGWITGFWLIFFFVWIFLLALILRQNVFEAEVMSPVAGTLLFLVLVWSLGIWGLNQTPGFEGHYVDEGMLDDAPKDGDSAPAAAPKYERSALDEEKAERIALKIRTAMEQDKLYLDPMLSLQKLSQHIMVSANHISQTLNSSIGECFFDYVNRWRINAAKPMVVANEATVLEIALAVGFNARSSFYNAFKRETGMTPGQYRKRHAG